MSYTSLKSGAKLKSSQQRKKHVPSKNKLCNFKFTLLLRLNRDGKDGAWHSLMRNLYLESNVQEMGLFTCFVIILLATGCSCVSLSWENVNAGGLIRSRWFAGTAYANNLLYVFGGQGTGFRVNDSGILGEMADIMAWIMGSRIKTGELKQ